MNASNAVKRITFIFDFLKRTWKQYQKELGDAAHKEFWGERKRVVDPPTRYEFVIQEHPITKHFYPMVYVRKLMDDKWFDGKNTHIIPPKDYTHSYYIQLSKYINNETKKEWVGVEKKDGTLWGGTQPCLTREEAEKAIAIYKEQELEMGIVKTTIEHLSMGGDKKLL